MESIRVNIYICPLQNSIKHLHFSEIPIDEEGCTDASDCASSVALCTAGSCVCPITHFTKNRECMESK